MESMQVSFEFLAQETMALTQIMLRERLEQENLIKAENRERKLNERENRIFPEVSGVLFYPEFGESTFCVRGVSCHNLNQAYSQLLSGDLEFCRKLKIENIDLFRVDYFQTKTFELAQIVCDQLINRRLPFYEEIVCNISDPGFSWWLEPTNRGFKVYFRSYGIDKTENSIKLGPIGDRVLSVVRFKQAEEYLRQFISFTEFAIDDFSFSVEVEDPEDSNFIKLMELFIFGSSEDLFHFFPGGILGQTLFYYFLELEAVRSFWLKIEEKLALEQILKQS